MPTARTSAKRSTRSASYIDMGYKAIRAQSGIPGLAMAYGVGRGVLHYEPADARAAHRNRVGHARST